MIAEPAVHRAVVRDGVELAFWREGAGGLPLLLVHGWPETKRIWIRNVAPLAELGFEVIVPDLRGFGDSAVPADGFHDFAAHARDLHALVHDVLGHERCAAAGGDVGGGAIQHLGLLFPGFLDRQVIFNTPLPLVAEAYAAAGLPSTPRPSVKMAGDYQRRQGHDPDGLMAELATPEQRVRYIAEFYGHRFWATPGAFTDDEARWHAEPFADAAKLRATFGNYESFAGVLPTSEPLRFRERNPVPTLALYGPDDHVIRHDFAERCEVVFPDLVGPFVVPRAGHFLQWERADLLNRATHAFLRDLVRMDGRSGL